MKTYEHIVAPGVVIKVTVPENDTTVDDLLSALRDVVPYAESRAEDMNEAAAAAHVRTINAKGKNAKALRGRAKEERAYAVKAWNAVARAKRLLRDNGFGPDHYP